MCLLTLPGTVKQGFRYATQSYICAPVIFKVIQGFGLVALLGSELDVGVS